MGLTARDLELRKHGIGASEISAVAGLNPYATAWDVWLEKTTGPSEAANDAMELGNLLEDGIARFYERKHPGVRLRKSRTLAHPEHSWALATPDRFVIEGGREVRLLEVKTAGRWVAGEWGSGVDEIPEAYIAQAQWQLFVTGKSIVDVAALVAGAPKFYRVERNDTLIAFLFDRGRAFIDLLARGDHPAIDASETARQWILDKFKKERTPLRDATNEELSLLHAYDDVRQSEKAIASKKELLANLIREAIGDAEGIEDSANRKTRALCRTPNGVTTRWEAIARELGVTPELIAKHSTPMTRRLDVRVKGQ